jgi:bifunctional UDP-N-acetylglucosamine pyrophosphorylase/glucosamine-1-phosphate N-acetyltransferase
MQEQRGTGHALMVAREVLAPYDLVIVLSGDAPLITPQTIEQLRDFHLSKKAADDSAHRLSGKSQWIRENRPQKKRAILRSRPSSNRRT